MRAGGVQMHPLSLSQTISYPLSVWLICRGVKDSKATQATMSRGVSPTEQHTLFKSLLWKTGVRSSVYLYMAFSRSEHLPPTHGDMALPRLQPHIDSCCASPFQGHPLVQKQTRGNNTRQRTRHARTRPLLPSMMLPTTARKAQ